ncbi:Malonate transporter, large subunit [Roseomonas mucosa]|uniref:malonate transporter subunit MadL n=1 Tax=Roseomonas mucosa TaxID=207340 RepID=UPI0021FA61A0|nr:malonate transporter subunit MadL [Roseomonas mucosa]QDJ08944.1 Malonate transporter, large subunit [Roseomonas mucosa]
MTIFGVALPAVCTPAGVHLRDLLGFAPGVKANVGGGGLAATDPRLVPYGALTANFHTGLGCLVAPSVLYLAVRTLMGG